MALIYNHGGVIGLKLWEVYLCGVHVWVSRRRAVGNRRKRHVQLVHTNVARQLR